MTSLRLAMVVLLTACSSTTIVLSTDASYDEQSDTQDASDSAVNEDSLSTFVDVRSFHDTNFVGIPDAASYDPTYTCISPTQYVECDYGDSGPCNVKSCLMFDSPVCFNGRCYAQ